jgi:hypothetical protein
MKFIPFRTLNCTNGFFSHNFCIQYLYLNLHETFLNLWFYLQTHLTQTVLPRQGDFSSVNVVTWEHGNRKITNTEETSLHIVVSQYYIIIIGILIVVMIVTIIQ